jgi:hypothetical protein
LVVSVFSWVTEDYRRHERFLARLTHELCAAAHSGERLRSDENEASVIKARTSVVSIACDLLNKLAIRLEDLFVSALEVNAFGKIRSTGIALLLMVRPRASPLTTLSLAGTNPLCLPKRKPRKSPFKGLLTQTQVKCRPDGVRGKNSQALRELHVQGLDVACDPFPNGGLIHLSALSEMPR